MRLSDTIDIEACTFVASGSMREVFTHPDDESVLVKVVRADMVGPDGHPNQKSRKRRRPWGVYLSFRREIDEYLIAARRQIEEPGLGLPFARPIGLVATTRGLGLLVERIAKDGEIVPTLRQRHRSGTLTQGHLQALRRFFAYCSAHHIVLSDVHPGNLVVDPANDDKLICIDGFGIRTLIPIHRYSRWLNTRRLARKLERALAELERPLP